MNLKTIASKSKNEKLYLSPKASRGVINNKFISIGLTLVSVIILILFVMIWIWSMFDYVGAYKYIIVYNYFYATQIFIFPIGFVASAFSLLVSIRRFDNVKSNKDKCVIKTSKFELIIFVLYLLIVIYVGWSFFVTSYGCRMVQFGDGTRGCFRGV